MPTITVTELATDVTYFRSLTEIHGCVALECRESLSSCTTTPVKVKSIHGILTSAGDYFYNVKLRNSIEIGFITFRYSPL